MSWCKISLECNGKDQASKEEVRELVVTDVPKCTGYANAVKTIETWETNLREYEIFSKAVLAELEKCATLKDMLPRDLRRDVNGQEKETCDDILRHVTRQIARRREEDKRTSRRKRVDLSAVVDEG